MKNQRILERARVEVKKLLNDPDSGALEKLQSIPGWRSIDLAKVVAEIGEERVTTGDSDRKLWRTMTSPWR